ncbi:Uncharacterised protein [uncultured archaeon]|nr:Uncharacterised protein [uncultured archaeon]
MHRISLSCHHLCLHNHLPAREEMPTRASSPPSLSSSPFLMRAAKDLVFESLSSHRGDATPGYHCSNKKIPVDIRSANYFIFGVHRLPCLIWADDDHSRVQLHIRVQRRIGASARSWLSLCRDQVSLPISALPMALRVFHAWGMIPA